MADRPAPADENLPEVVPDTSPQVLSSREAYLAHEHLGEKDPKYAADSAPRPEERDLKFAIDEQGGKSPLVKGDDGVWRPAPVSALSPTDTRLSPDVASPDPQSAAEEGRGGGEEVKEVKEETVCGIRKKTFWILVGVAVVIVLAAIGGGVGGGISARNSRAAAEQDSSPPPDDKEFLNNGTTPDRGIAFQAFSEPKYGGQATEIYTTEGFHDLPFDAVSYVWVPNDSGCCISFCQDEKNTTSSWCQPRYREEAEESFPRLGVLCGNMINRYGKVQPCAEKET